MASIAADGSTNVTVVSGNVYTGMYAADGSLNVVLNDGSTFTGNTHPCGALNVVLYTSGQPVFIAPNGSVVVSVSPYVAGTFGVTVVKGAFDTTWVVTGAVADFDFVNRRYYVDSALFYEEDFASFTSSTFSNGLVLDGTASHDVQVSWSDLNLSSPFSIHSSFTPGAITATQIVVAADIDASNTASLGVTAAAALNWFIVTANTTNANINTPAAGANGVRATTGGQFETNNGLASLNGGTSGVADVTVTLFTPTNLRFGKRVSNTQGFNGTLHRVVLFSGSKTQVQLNADNALVQAA